MVEIEEFHCTGNFHFSFLFRHSSPAQNALWPFLPRTEVRGYRYLAPTALKAKQLHYEPNAPDFNFREEIIAFGCVREITHLPVN